MVSFKSKNLDVSFSLTADTKLKSMDLTKQPSSQKVVDVLKEILQNDLLDYMNIGDAAGVDGYFINPKVVNVV